MSSQKPIYVPASAADLSALVEAGWTNAKGERHCLSKQFRFKGFKRAFKFMTLSAEKAVELNRKLANLQSV